MKQLLCAGALALTLTACSGKATLHMQPVATNDVRVTPTELVISRGKLWVKLMVMNTTNGPLMVQRDQIFARLPNGQSLTRAVGSGAYGYGWGYGYNVESALHLPYYLPPGAMHPVHVEFEEQGFKWDDVPSLWIDFGGAVTRNGEVVRVPPFVLTR